MYCTRAGGTPQLPNQSMLNIKSSAAVPLFRCSVHVAALSPDPAAGSAVCHRMPDTAALLLLPLLLEQRWPLYVMLTGWPVPQPGRGWKMSKVCVAAVKLWAMQPWSSAATSVSAAAAAATAGAKGGFRRASASVVCDETRSSPWRKIFRMGMHYGRVQGHPLLVQSSRHVLKTWVSLTYVWVLAHPVGQGRHSSRRHTTGAQPKHQVSTGSASDRPLLDATLQPCSRGFVKSINPSPQDSVKVGAASLPIPREVGVAGEAVGPYCCCDWLLDGAREHCGGKAPEALLRCSSIAQHSTATSAQHRSK
jgi:hypothetical protein